MQADVIYEIIERLQQPDNLTLVYRRIQAKNHDVDITITVKSVYLLTCTRLISTGEKFWYNWVFYNSRLNDVSIRNKIEILGDFSKNHDQKLSLPEELNLVK